MGKRSRQQVTSARTPGEVSPRQPCPCGSGKRYKACHGAPGGAISPTYVARPYEGMPSECDVIALRELVPAATAPLDVRDTDRSVQLCTLLPGASPAMVRENGDIWLGLQVVHQYGDPARDLGAVLEKALATTEPGPVGLTSAPGEGARLQDLVMDDELAITVHDGFDYWLADVDADNDMLKAAIRQDWRHHPPVQPAVGSGSGVLDQRGTEGTPALGDAGARGPAPDGVGAPARVRRRRAGPRIAVGRDVPRARAVGPGLGPGGRHRSRGASESGGEVPGRVA